MPNPVIIIQNPLELDYSNLIKQIIPKIIGSNRLDVLIKEPIKNVTNLNDILYNYYNLIRNEINKFNFEDYNFQINIIFNISFSKYKKLLQNWNHIFISSKENDLQNLPIPITEIDTELSEVKLDSNCSKISKQFETTAVGGTFDHLHDGHKILLSMAYFLTLKRMIIGITGNELLKNKKFKEVLETFTKRKQSVIQFLDIIFDDLNLRFEIYEINDICGPTGYLPNINSLIISHETLKGGEFVNKYRQDHGFKKLDITAIKVIGDKNSNENNLWKGKLSSTDIRERELKKLKQLENIN
ncbi:uncharacterized protein KGF55_004773 [Candida pseudojiufengensis]|uniref:uncharacterized protein n=1 Tax=Candida pseudojiufengensis TaxID=497109 RepID=UPI002224996A|nr:uncharacterized protein KGF55_004773 [Candida pseudojiufengensis]KAI5960050.1 hypothetical protein KGF55_004773 [Candida pseudojiufengensis]